LKNIFLSKAQVEEKQTNKQTEQAIAGDWRIFPKNKSKKRYFIFIEFKSVYYTTKIKLKYELK
jgi:hypothetical protein